MRFIFGIFLVLHGLVHLLYFGQSARYFEIQPGMMWPDGSWAFSKLLGDKKTRWLTNGACILAAIGFVVGGGALLAGQAWWQPIIVSGAIFSASLYVLLWDGSFQDLDDKGIFAILINLALLFVVLFLKWPTI